MVETGFTLGNGPDFVKILIFMFYVYILKSTRNNKYYIGYTSNIEERLRLHNSGRVLATKNYRPWGLFYLERFNTEKEAINRERRIKSWKSRSMIEKLKF